MFNIWKPWYLCRPQQLLYRAATLFADPVSDYTSLSAAWGITMLASPAEHLGQCLRTTGIYDIGVSEVIFRLMRAGDLFVDAGANLGYMTLLGAVASGPGGRAIAFEPNPDLFPLLTRNIDAECRRTAMASVEPREAALGARAGRATLVLPRPEAHNNGLAHISRDGDEVSGQRSVSVRVDTLDDIIGMRTVGLLKIDVEGHEHPLLQGAARTLGDHRIRHVVFEDHEGITSAAARLLSSAGYTLFSIGWSITKPILRDAREGASAASPYEAGSYLATIAPEEAVRACSSPGWRALRRQTRPIRSA